MDNSVVSSKMFLHRYTHLTLVWQVLYLQKTIPFYGTTWNHNLSSLQLIQALNIVMKSNLSFVFTILRLLFMHYGDLQNSFTLPPSNAIPRQSLWFFLGLIPRWFSKLMMFKGFSMFWLLPQFSRDQIFLLSETSQKCILRVFLASWESVI